MADGSSMTAEPGKESIDPVEETEGRDSPSLACDLDAIDEEEREPHRRAAQAVFSAAGAPRKLPTGYAFPLPADTEIIESAAAFIARERLCCPFFRFTMRVEPDGGEVWLEVTGDVGVKAYLQDALLPRLSEG